MVRQLSKEGGCWWANGLRSPMVGTDVKILNRRGASAVRGFPPLRRLACAEDAEEF